jgi:MFS family permease
VQGVVFQVVMAKVIPIERRGRLLGLRDVASGTVLIGVAAIGGWLVERFGFSAGNGYTFLLAVREPAGRELRAPSRLRERLRELPALLRAEPDFRRFLSARLLASAARGVLPLYIVWIGRELGMTGARLGTFTVIFSLAQSSSTMLWGWLGDRGGYKRVFQLSNLCGLAGTALLLASSNVWLASATYALVGAGMGGFVLAGSNLVLEFGTERERAMRIATHNAATELVGMLGFVAAGLLADGVSFRSAFLASIALQALAIVRLSGLRDPRRRA